VQRRVSDAVEAPGVATDARDPPLHPFTLARERPVEPDPLA